MSTMKLVVKDPTCPNCKIPLRAVMHIYKGRCVNLEACNARRSYLDECGHMHLITPEGVTRIESTKENHETGE